MTKKTDTIPAHRVSSRGRKGQRRPARSSHTARGCRRRRKAARGTAGSLCAEPGFAEKRYLEPETEVNLQGESWTERRGIQGPGGEHVPGHSGNLEEPAKQWGKKTEGEQGEVRQGLGSRLGESEFKSRKVDGNTVYASSPLLSGRRPGIVHKPPLFAPMSRTFSVSRERLWIKDFSP